MQLALRQALPLRMVLGVLWGGGKGGGTGRGPAGGRGRGAGELLLLAVRNRGIDVSQPARGAGGNVWAHTRHDGFAWRLRTSAQKVQGMEGEVCAGLWGRAASWEKPGAGRGSNAAWGVAEPVAKLWGSEPLKPRGQVVGPKAAETLRPSCQA